MDESEVSGEVAMAPLEGVVVEDGCQMAGDPDPFTGRPSCYGELTTGFDPYALDVYGEKVVYTLCALHLQQEHDAI